MDAHLDRRTFLKTSLVATAGAFTLGSTFLRSPARADHPALVPADGPYGPYGLPDENGVRLPDGFTSRIIARSGTPVEGTITPWHIYPDGGATFATEDGGWIYVSNSEVPGGNGGAGAIRFAADGSIVASYRILAGTSSNCAGGPTPWGTWLSCEEFIAGQVWECDPTGERRAQLRPAMGMFAHEAAAVDPVLGHVYMTEDVADGRLYRFTPEAAGHLSSGSLEVATVDESGSVDWFVVPNPTPVPFVQTSTRRQVPESTAFDSGEGIWFDVPTRTVYFTTKGDNRVWEYDVDAGSLQILHERLLIAGSPLIGVDNLVVSSSGDMFICEDGGNMEMVLITPDGQIAPFLQVQHSGSELAGVAFNPAGDRLIFSSQRGERLGVTFEITGPFRT